MGVLSVHEAVVHDVRVWPHTHSSAAADPLFLLVVEAEAIEGASEEMLGEHAALHNRWATI